MLQFSVLEEPAEPSPARKLTPAENAEVEAALVNGRRPPKRKKLVNVYSQQAVQVWLMLDPKDGLRVTEIDPDEDVGEIPEWYSYEHSEMGWDSILGVLGHSYSTPDGDGNSWSESEMCWGLHEGIAPGQPFLVELPHPYYSKHWTDCGYEYDTDYSPEIIQVLKWTSKRVARAWERELKAEQRFRAAEALRRTRRKALQRHDVQSMFIVSDVYFSPGQSSYDDMEMPSGVSYSLQTTADLGKKQCWSTATLARGEDHKGDYEKAMKDLIAKALVALPHLTEAQIRALPKRHGRW